MRLEVLVATMNRENIDFLENMQIKTDAIVINQCGREDQEVIEREGKKITFKSFNEKGLSRSRNRALEEATADICLIADDDVVYASDYEKKILEAYATYKDADIIAFQVTRLGAKRLKKYRLKPKKQSWLSCMKISSVEITFKREQILKQGIRFKTLFGAGAYFNNGEENIFLYDCLRKGLKIMYVPIEIGSVSCEESSWFEGYNRHYFRSMGAGYFGMSKRWGWLLSWQHLLRHYKLYKNEKSFFSIAKEMKEGRKLCSKLLKKEEKRQPRTLLVGDFQDDNGPAIVNKHLQALHRREMCYTLARGKLGRLIEVIIKGLKADVIGLSGLSQINRLAILWAKLLHKPTFYLMHGYVKQELYYEHLENKRLVKLEEWTLKQVNQIIPVSKNFQDYLSKQIPDQAYKMHYVNNGIDWGEFKEKETEEKREALYYVVTSMGGGSHLKNNLTVCQAIEHIRSRLDRPIYYRVIGQDGMDTEAIMKYDFVVYCGQVSHKDVLRFLEESDLYIQNSFFESFSLGAVEALMKGNRLLIGKEVGVLSILGKLETNHIIYNTEDIGEIGDKIMSNLQQIKNFKLIQQLKREETSWEAMGSKLCEVSTSLWYRGWGSYDDQ